MEEENITMNAATVVILRQVNNCKTKPLWSVLLGQNVVKNWLRSTPNDDVIMRYPGEWKFPGGVCDEADATLEDTAIRELNEEFLGLNASLTKRSTLYLINRKLTRPIKGRQYWMHNFVAIDSEPCNEWIEEGIKNIINANLEKRMKEFTKKLSDNSYWDLAMAEKSQLSPELLKVNWININEAIRLMSSAKDRAHLDFVNEYQKIEFRKYHIQNRDPMYQSMVTLQEINELGSIENIKKKHQEIMASLG